MVEPPAKRAKAQQTTLFLIRHGDRYDFANKQIWRTACEEYGFEERDPPLSALGHEQARDAAAVLSKESLDLILVSPYLRVLQTAQPLAHAIGLPMNVEEGLSETAHVLGMLPSAGQRFQYFPETNIAYESILKVEATGEDAHSRAYELFPQDYLKRLVKFAKLIPKHFVGKRVAMFSHAASVALVAALTGTKLLDAGVFAPAGIFKLVSHDDGTCWTLEAHGGDNSAHIKKNNPKTFPWGFTHVHDFHGSSVKKEDDAKIVVTSEMIEQWWEEALQQHSSVL